MLIVNCGPDMKNKGSLGMLAKKVLLGSGCDNGGARFEVFSMASRQILLSYQISQISRPLYRSIVCQRDHYLYYPG